MPPIHATARPAVLVVLALAGLLAQHACSSDSTILAGTQVDVAVTSGGGTGSGRVVADAGTVPAGFDIDCEITAGAEDGACSDGFNDAGGGGSFALTAVPEAGSEFTGWTGCDAPGGNPLSCGLSFDAGDVDVDFDVTARFDLVNAACVEVKAGVPNDIAGTGPATPVDLEPAYGAEALANPSFEQVVTIGTVGQLVPAFYGYWQGDRNSRVGSQQGLTPDDQAFMVQFIATGLVAGATGTAELIQLVKVSHLEPDVADGRVRATFSARFNRVEGCDETDSAMLMVIAAMPGDPSESQARWTAGYLANTDEAVAGGWLRRYRASLATDANPGTWEELQLVADLPAGTTYVVAALGAFENVHEDEVFPELHGHYVDAASLVLSRLD
jgi:hypothetical protein